ncbi:PadR family transcriptional regulator [Roseivirga sp. 4D4]|uniref:PadR family transcriptional regulator n=1 Tax=Roseivirga sp. 4D4 TaxID=1889784 RepID=UPI000852B684|nr:helix-turn-helix transcriptional regulator [Roseivirga sp. 4D4]OEK01183.1 PadR family transcriptional regulator [Roseivirga sp. 4D4]
MRQAIGEFEEIVLLVVAAQHDQAYGLSVTEAIEEQLKRSVKLSSVHTSLYRLEEKGLVESRIGDTSTLRGGRKKRHFTITTLGKRALVETQEARKILWNQIPNNVLDIPKG